MRKGWVFWGAFLSGFALIALALVYVGREPEIRCLAAAIPQPEEASPYVYIEGEGKTFALSLPEAFSREAGQPHPFVDGFRHILPLLRQAKEMAALLVWENNDLHLFLASIYSQETVKNLSKGVLPEAWRTKMAGLVLEKYSEGIYILKGPSPFFPLYLSVNGGITLFATTAEKIISMNKVLESKKGSISIAWHVEKNWANHARIFDGGLFSQMASMEGFPVSMGGLVITAAWTEDAKGGRLKWKTDGIEVLFPSGVLEKLQPVKWDERFIAVDPFITAFGVNIPAAFSHWLEQTDVGQWVASLGMKEEEMKKFLPGTVMGALCGTSKFLVFSLPGLLFQFPDRGTAGEAFVQSFWDQDWSILVPTVEKVEDFPVGGATSIPFSIVGAAKHDMVRLGLLDRENLKPDKYRKLTDLVPVLKEGKEALCWLYLDAPRLGDAMQNLARAGKTAEKMGRDLGMNLQDLFQTASALKGLGSISAMLPSMGEGILEWTRRPSPIADGRRQKK